MVTISVVYICSKDKEYLKESLESAKPIADEICITYDKNKVDEDTLCIVNNFRIENPNIPIKEFFRLWDIGTLQKQYAIERATMDYVLCLDSDEILSDNTIELKNIITLNPGIEAFNIRGHHFIHSLLLEDSSVENHYWVARLFKNHIDIHMEGKNHALTSGYKGPTICIDNVRIYHMGYTKHLDKIMERYHENINHGLQIHSLEFLDSWKNAHILGNYPCKRFDINNLPKPLIDKFLLKDIISYNYFKDRMELEPKHFLEVSVWKDNLQLDEYSKVLEVGCGAGQRILAFKTYGVNVTGFDVDEWIIKNSLTPQQVTLNSAINMNDYFNKDYDLIYSYDCLEHLTYEQLDLVLSNFNKSLKKGGKILLSIPFIGDPNLNADPTHRIKEVREWWVKKIEEKGFKIILTPEHFYYKEQIIIGEKI